MRDQLLAFPIGGEAFLLRRHGYTVLVDGGLIKDKITTVIATHVPAVKTLDVVVCTHGDGDHAAGLPNLLRCWPGQIGQVWLPGRWVEVVPELMKNPKGFMNTLIQQLDTIIHENRPDPVARLPFERSEESFKLIRSDTPQRPKDASTVPDAAKETVWDDEDWDDHEIDLDGTEPTDDPPWFAELRNAENLATEKVSSIAFRSARSRVIYRRDRSKKRRINATVASAWLGMIDTVEAIRGIAAAAIVRRLRVRWFDYQAFVDTGQPSGGVRGFLEPINAREQAPAPLELSFLASLTLINRQSLVFFAPPTSRRLGVLFCGDSPLGDGSGFGNSFLRHRASPSFPIVATAPHHGAETNCAAYNHMCDWADVMVLLRAGGRSNQPGPTFKKLDWSLKVCAICPQSGRSPHFAGVSGPGPGPGFVPAIIAGALCGCT